MTDCQTIFGYMNSVKNWSVLPELTMMIVMELSE